MPFLSHLVLEVHRHLHANRTLYADPIDHSDARFCQWPLIDRERGPMRQLTTLGLRALDATDGSGKRMDGVGVRVAAV